MKSLLVKNIKLIDPVAGKLGERSCDVKVEKGRFAEIAPSGKMSANGIKAIDGEGRYALPGLIDCHAHTCGFFLPDFPGLLDFRWIPYQIGLNYRAHLQSGVTVVRDMMAPLRLIKYIRSKAEDPASKYPRILCSGPMLTVKGGYPAFVPRDFILIRAFAGPLRVEMKNARDAVKWVDRLAWEGVDCIKMGYSSRDYDNERTPLNTPTDEMIKAVADRAHHHNLQVAMHHTWLEDVQKLVDLPFDSLEHLTAGGDIDERTLDRMAERKLPVTTNLEVFNFLDEPQNAMKLIEEGRAPLVGAAKRGMIKILKEVAEGRPPNPHFGMENLRGAAAQMAKNLKRMYDRGIMIGSATDAGTNQMFGTLPDELCHMVKAGMPEAAVIRAATSDAAKILNLNDAGRIETGCHGDMVLYNENPLENIQALQKPTFVMRDGLPVNL